MSSEQPRDGDHTSTWLDKGYTVSLHGELRSPSGHAVSGWNGQLTDAGGSVRDIG